MSKLHSAAGKYDGINFKPPASVANAAKKGLEYREKASPSNKGGLTPSEASKQGIGSGVQRAVNLKNRDNVTPETISKMVSFFARHEKNKGIAPKHKGEPWNDKGYVAWLLWGGDPGKAWANKIKAQMDKATKKKSKTAASIDHAQLMLDIACRTPDARLSRKLVRQASVSLVLAPRMLRADALDNAQVALDVAGLVPIAGEVADFLNVVISLARKDYVGSFLSLISMIPEAGDAVGKGGKLLVWMQKLAKQQGSVGKAAKIVLEKGPQAKMAIRTASKALKQFAPQIKKAIRFAQALVADPAKAKDMRGLPGLVAKVLSGPRGEALRKRVAPHIAGLSTVFNELLTFAERADKVLEAPAEAA